MSAADQSAPDIILSRVMQGVVGTPREARQVRDDPAVVKAVAGYLEKANRAPSGDPAKDMLAVVETYEIQVRERVNVAACRLLDLEGKRIRFRDERVRDEILSSTRGERIPHLGDARGLPLHPVLLEALATLADIQCFELGWLRATHGKYKTTAGDTSKIDADAEISAHFYGMGADFYAVGSSLDRLVTHDAGQAALDDALRPFVQAIWNDVAHLPNGWWVVMPPSLNPETPGVRRGVEFFSNDRHRNHLHIGLNN